MRPFFNASTICFFKSKNVFFPLETMFQKQPTDLPFWFRGAAVAMSDAPVSTVKVIFAAVVTESFSNSTFRLSNGANTLIV